MFASKSKERTISPILCSALRHENNARMWTHSEVGAKKIRIVRDKHATFADCELELSFVRRLDQASVVVVTSIPRRRNPRATP